MKKTFIKKGMREIWAHKVQYFMLALVIGLGVAAYSSFNDFGRYRGDGLDQIYSESNFMDLQVTMNYGETMTVQEVTEIFETNGLSSSIEDWDMRLVFDIFIEHEVGREMKITKGQVMGQSVQEGMDPRGAVSVNRPLYYVDDPDSYSQNVENECYIERKFSEAYGLDPGSSINVNRGEYSRNLSIVEQVAVPEYFFVMREGDLAPNERAFGVLLLPLSGAMDLYTGGNYSEMLVNDIVLTVAGGVDVKALEDEIQEAFEAKGVALKFTEKDENPSRYFLISDYENDKESMNMFPVIIFFVSAFALVMALRRMIRSHRPQIGIFKALGIPNRSIMTYFSVIGIIIALLGTLLGYLLSIPFNMAFLRLGMDLLDFPVDQYNITYVYYLYGAIISIVLCLSCVLIPAALAVRVKPLDVIQGREGMSKKKIGGLGTILAKKGFLPVSLKLTVRNQLRKPFRSLSTVIGVAISLALFMGFMMVMESAIVAFEGSITEMEWDYEVRTEGFQTLNITSDWMETYDGIDNIYPAIMLPSILNPEDDEYGALVYASSDVDVVFDLEYKRGEEQYGTIVISRYHSDRLGLSLGENISIELPVLDPVLGFRMEVMNISVGGIHTNYMGSYAFMSLPTMYNLTGLYGMLNTIHVLTNDDVEIREMENDLITRKGVSTVSHTSDNENLMENYMNILIGTVVVMAVISAILAGAIVYIMFRISAREQERDYATMKTLGTTLKKIAKLIFQEGGYITVLGILASIPCSYGFAWLMLNQPEYETMNIVIRFSWPAFIAGSIMIVFVVFFVSIFTLRYIAKINIANVIRERNAG